MGFLIRFIQLLPTIISVLIIAYPLYRLLAMFIPKGRAKKAISTLLLVVSTTLTTISVFFVATALGEQNEAAAELFGAGLLISAAFLVGAILFRRRVKRRYPEFFEQVVQAESVEEDTTDTD